jgi:hypothetical protein
MFNSCALVSVWQKAVQEGIAVSFLLCLQWTWVDPLGADFLLTGTSCSPHCSVHENLHFLVTTVNNLFDHLSSFSLRVYASLHVNCVACDTAPSGLTIQHWHVKCVLRSGRSLAICFTLVSCVFHSWILKMEETLSSETSVDFQRTTHFYILQFEK